jgi:hypothetical protein
MATVPVDCLYRQSCVPVLQNRLFLTAEEGRACETGEVTLQQHPTTGIVYNTSFDSSLVVYDTQYNNEQSASDVFQSHMHDAQEIVARTIGRQSLVEIGCGKGVFLDNLLRDGFEITGYDPAYEGPNPLIERRLFEPAKTSAAEGLILRHVLEHIPSPADFLAEIARSNHGKGLIYIEVPCLDWILNQHAWWDIFYEHVNYFRLIDFNNLFERVVDSGRLFGGQYLYVVADLGSLRSRPSTPLLDVQFPDGLRPDVRLEERYPAHAVWGAGSKGVIFSIFTQRTGGQIDAVIDINPSKQGRYMPVTGYRVDTPAEAIERLPFGSCIHVMNPNYLEEVRAVVGNRHQIKALQNSR